jgi:SAM-dependent methyltransferase
MDDAAVQSCIDRFESALARHGATRAALCDGRGGRHDVRFPVLAAPALEDPQSSVLDIGCGFADLYGFLRANGWHGRYTGVDIVPGLLATARERFPEIELHRHDASDNLDGFAPHDFVIASSIMNLELPNGGNPAHIERFLGIMFAHASRALCVDFMTTHVDFKHPGGWHTDPVWAWHIANRLTRRITLRADYMPFEFALILYKDVSTSPRNVYRGVGG